MLTVCMLNEDMPDNMGPKKYATDILLKRILEFYRKMPLDTKVAEQIHGFLGGMEQVGRAYPGNPVSLCMIMKRKMLQLFLSVPQELLTSQTALLQVGYVLGRSGWPLNIHAINGMSKISFTV